MHRPISALTCWKRSRTSTPLHPNTAGMNGPWKSGVCKEQREYFVYQEQGWLAPFLDSGVGMVWPAAHSALRERARRQSTPEMTDSTLAPRVRARDSCGWTRRSWTSPTNALTSYTPTTPLSISLHRKLYSAKRSEW